MNDEIQSVIESTIDMTIMKMKKAGLMKNNEKSAFKKTEELLRAYKDFCTIPHEEGAAKTLLPKVKEAIKSLQSDDYAGLIEMIYVDGKTREECAEFYGVEPLTITRNKKRLVNKLKNIIFTDETIKELFL